MKNRLRELPDLGNAAKLLKISVELEGINFEDAGMIGQAIHAGLRKKNIKDIVKMLRSMAADNYPMVEAIVGKTLLEEINSVIII